MLLIILIILLIIIGYLILNYYRLLNQIEIVKNHQQEIDYLLNKRFKLIESLSEKYSLQEAISLHQAAEQAKIQGDEKNRFLAENQISKILLAIKEEELITQLEKNLIYAKQAYHDSVELYNLNKINFPANFILPYFRDLDIHFPIWE